MLETRSAPDHRANGRARQVENSPWHAAQALCLPGGPQPGLGDCRQPGSHRELAGASQLSCPHPDSRVLSAQAGRQDRKLWEACGGLLGPWSFSAVAALGGGGRASSLPSPGQVSGPGTLVEGWGLQLSAWSGGQSSGRCRGVDVPVSAPARCQPPPGDLGGHSPAQASLCSSGTVGLSSWKDMKPRPPDLGSTDSAGPWDLGLGGRTRPRSLVLEARVGALVPRPTPGRRSSWPVSLKALPKAWSCFLECLPTNIFMSLVGSVGLWKPRKPLWLFQVSWPAGPSHRSHLEDPGGPPSQARWAHAPLEGYPEGMTH